MAKKKPMVKSPQTPLIVESMLTRPSRWFILTRYEERRGINTVTGEDVSYLKAITKYDVTGQMWAILKRCRSAIRRTK